MRKEPKTLTPVPTGHREHSIETKNNRIRIVTLGRGRRVVEIYQRDDENPLYAVETESSGMVVLHESGSVTIKL